MAFGHISRLMSERGIGFIVDDDAGEEIEFHWTALAAGRLEQMQPGQRVQFETQLDHRNSGRKRAVNIRLAGWS